MPDPTLSPRLRDPWLVAVWPGLGNVALAAGAYLVEKLPMTPLAELDPERYYDMLQLEVQQGIARRGEIPRGRFFAYRNPDAGGRDLLVFAAEAQPTTNGFAQCREVIAYAQAQGVSRVISIAALGTQLHPTQEPDLYASVTDPAMLAELPALGAKPLREGQIGGLNGVILVAGLERNIPGVCLMAEIPFFAANVPNLRSSLVVLRALSAMARVDLDLTTLEQRSEAVTAALLNMLERLQRDRESDQGDDDDDDDDQLTSLTLAEEQALPSTPPEAPGAGAASLPPEARQRIEKLFEQAKSDRHRAVQLKAELDRLGVFREYEDRFLDLFRRAS